MKLSFKKLFFVLAFLFCFFAIMIFAKVVLIPLSIALLISFMLLPVVKRLEGWGVNTLLSSLLSVLLMIGIIGGGITLFSAEIMNLSDEVNDFTGKILKTFSEALVFINNNIHFIDDLNRDELIVNGKKWIKESSGFLLQNTFSNTASFLTGLVSSIVFTFLLLLYRKGLTNAFVAFGDDHNKRNVFRMLKNIQRVGKKHLSGMLLLVIIMGLANSIGLWIIGIDSPFLFGFLAATLSIVPFVGGLIGAIIPVLYALMSTDSLLIPLAVIILFWGVQVIETNFLTPKIVGSNINVNALIAILSLLIGATMWGVAGMVLFLPFAAMLKVVCEEFDQLRPVSMLISNNISNDGKERTKASGWIDKIKGWFKKK